MLSFSFLVLLCAFYWKPSPLTPIQIDLPKIESSSDVVRAVGCIINAVGIGQISPSEGEALARIVDIHTKALELNEFERRLAALEGGKR